MKTRPKRLIITSVVATKTAVASASFLGSVRTKATSPWDEGKLIGQKCPFRRHELGTI
jgi:hypothetical protein